MGKSWVIFMAIATGVFLWFAGNALLELWKYSRLGSIAEAQVYEWKIKELSPSKFALIAAYTFNASGKENHGETMFAKPYYLNRPSAEKDIEKWRLYSWKVWYQAAHPEISSLQKLFPFKNCFQAFLSLIVLVYFYFLRNYTKKLVT